MQRLILLFLLSFLFLSHIQKKPKKTNMTYRFQASTSGKRHPPLLVFLHGLGSNEDDLFSLAPSLDSRFQMVSIRAPHAYGQGGFAWFDVQFTADNKRIIDVRQAEQSRLQLLEFLEDLQKEHPYDPSQVYLCGFSQGAMMALSLGLTRPDQIKGLMALSGRILEEVKPLVASPEKLVPLEIFVLHGIEDQMMPIQYARDTRVFLASKGIKSAYHEVHAVHTITEEGLKLMVNWLKDKG